MQKYRILWNFSYGMFEDLNARGFSAPWYIQSNTSAVASTSGEAEVSVFQSLCYIQMCHELS